MSQSDPKTQVRVIGAKGDIEQLQQHLATAAAGVTVDKVAPADAGTNLSFSVDDLTTLTALIGGATALIDFCKAIYGLMKTDKGKTIVIQTPTGRVEIHSDKELTEDEVRDTVRRAARLL